MALWLIFQTCSLCLGLKTEQKLICLSTNGKILKKGYKIILHKILDEKDLSVGKVEQNTLIHGDCLNVMQYIADGSIDAIITDLPYG